LYTQLRLHLLLDGLALVPALAECTLVPALVLVAELCVYWTFNLLMAIAATFASVHIHFKSDVDEAISEGTAWTFASALGVAWVAVFLAFLVLMKKKYRATFFSVESGNQ